MEKQQINRTKFNSIGAILGLMAILILLPLMSGQAQAAAAELTTLGHDHTKATRTDVIIPNEFGQSGISPYVSKGTSYGSVHLGTSVEHTFVIRSTGTLDLDVHSITFTGTAASDFTVTQQPVSPVLPGQETEFIIRFTPSQEGLRFAQVHFGTNAPSPEKYFFSLAGTGTQELVPHMVVSSNAHDIGNGDNTPIPLDNTDFGSVVNDGSSFIEQTFIISNSGAIDLNLTGGTPLVEIHGAAAGDFSVITQPHSTIASHTQTEFKIRFQPSADGLRHATVSIANDDATSNPYTFAIQGTGTPEPKPHMNILFGHGGINHGNNTPSVYEGTDFGSARIGSDGVEHQFFVWNTGNADIHLTGTPNPVVIKGNATGDFTVTLQPTPVTHVHQVGFRIRFKPSIEGDQFATVSIANNDTNANPYTFNIKGEGTPGPKSHMLVVGDKLNIGNGDTTPAIADNTHFGATTIGGVSVDHTFQINNGGTADLNLTGTPKVTIVGAEPGDFSVITPPAASIGSKQVSPLIIRFTPSELGVRHATVSIANDDATSDPYTFAIQGNGTPAPKPHMVVVVDQHNIVDGDNSPSAADNTDFGATTIGGVSVDHTFHINNSGNADLNLTGTPIVAISGAASEFTVITPPATTIGSSHTSPIVIRFTPTKEGPQHATVSIANDDATSSHYTFAIVGTGTPEPKPHMVVVGNQHNIAELDMTPSTADNTDFGTTTIGGVSVDHTFQINNAGSADLNLTYTPKVLITGAAAGDFTVITQPAATIGRAQASPMIIRFTPTEDGVRHATVTIVNSDQDRSIYIFAIQGTGTAVPKPHMLVSGNQHNIGNGDTTPAICSCRATSTILAMETPRQPLRTIPILAVQSAPAAVL